MAGHSPAVGFVALTCCDSLPVHVDVVCAKTCYLNASVYLQPYKGTDKSSRVFRGERREILTV